MTAAVTGPSFISLQVHDLACAAAFYETKLGLTRAPQSPPGAIVFTTSPIAFAVREPPPGTDLDSGQPGLGVALWLAAENAATTVGDAVTVRLGSADTGPTGRALLRAEDGVINIELAVAGLEVPDELQTYELWLVHDEGRVSASTSRPGPEGDVRLDLAAAGPLTRYNRVGITLEPDDRDPSRNGDTVIAGTLTS